MHKSKDQWGSESLGSLSGRALTRLCQKGDLHASGCSMEDLGLMRSWISPLTTAFLHPKDHWTLCRISWSQNYFRSHAKPWVAFLFPLAWFAWIKSHSGSSFHSPSNLKNPCSHWITQACTEWENRSDSWFYLMSSVNLFALFILWTHNPGPGEMPQWVKWSQCKYENLSLDLQKPHLKKWVWHHSEPLIPELGR